MSNETRYVVTYQQPSATGRLETIKHEPQPYEQARHFASLVSRNADLILVSVSPGLWSA